MDNPVMFNDPMGDTAPAKATVTQFLQQFVDLVNQRDQSMSFHRDGGNAWLANDGMRYIFSDRVSDFDEGGGGGGTSDYKDAVDRFNAHRSGNLEQTDKDGSVHNGYSAAKPILMYDFGGLLDGIPNPASWNFTPAGPGGRYQVAGVSGINFTFLYYGENSMGRFEFGFNHAKIKPLYFEYPLVRKTSSGKTYIVQSGYAASFMAASTGAAIEATEAVWGRIVPTQMNQERMYRFFSIL